MYCDPDSLDIALLWTNTTTGLVADGGWDISSDGLILRFNVEDSLADCGGVNGNTQEGLATTTFTLTEPATLKAIMDGLAEPFVSTSGVESMTVTVSGLLIAYGESPVVVNPSTCVAEPISVLERRAYLRPGTYTLEVFVTTTDAQLHSGVFFETELQFSPL